MNKEDREKRHLEGGKFPINTYRFHPRDLQKAVNIISELTEAQRTFAVNADQNEIVINFTGEPL